MGAPAISYSAQLESSSGKISGVAPHDKVVVTFEADTPYKAFECRATKAGESYGRGGGTLIASFSQTPANTPRTFEIYDDFLVHGDGSYRISLYAQGEDGSWNDTEEFTLADNERLILADGKEFQTQRFSTT